MREVSRVCDTLCAPSRRVIARGTRVCTRAAGAAARATEFSLREDVDARRGEREKRGNVL